MKILTKIVLLFVLVYFCLKRPLILLIIALNNARETRGEKLSVQRAWYRSHEDKVARRGLRVAICLIKAFAQTQNHRIPSASGGTTKLNLLITDTLNDIMAIADIPGMVVDVSDLLYKVTQNGELVMF